MEVQIFFPAYLTPYSYYTNHLPEIATQMKEDVCLPEKVSNLVFFFIKFDSSQGWENLIRGKTRKVGTSFYSGNGNNNLDLSHLPFNARIVFSISNLDDIQKLEKYLPNIEDDNLKTFIITNSEIEDFEKRLYLEFPTLKNKYNILKSTELYASNFS